MTKEFNTNFRVGQGGLIVVTADFTIVSTNKPRVVQVDATAGPVTLTFPKAVGIGGKRICVMKIDGSANAVTVVPDATDNLNDQSSDSLANQFDSFDYMSDNQDQWTKVSTPGGGNGGNGGGLPVDVSAQFQMYDDFFYATASLVQLWENILGTGGIDITISAVGGVVGRNSSGETGSGAGIRLNQNSLCNVDNDFQLRWRIRGTTITLLAMRAGLQPANSNPGGTFPFGTEPTPYIWFAHDSSGNFFARTHDGSTPNSTDTGIPIDTAFHLFEIIKTGSSIEFKIDGVSVATFTTNLPTGNLQMMSMWQDGENVSKQVQWDTAQLVNDLD